MSEISLRISDAEQLLIAPGSLLYGNRMLTLEAESLIVESVITTSSRDLIHIKIYLLKDDSNKKDKLATAFHHHFVYKREKSERQLKKVLQLGWRSLLISIGLLCLIIWLTPVIERILPDGGLSITFRELLIILGWVALWRPVDILLFDWRPFKREVNLYRRLEKCTVEIILQEKPE